MVRAKRLAEAAASVNEMLYRATVSINQVRPALVCAERDVLINACVGGKEGLRGQPASHKQPGYGHTHRQHIVQPV